MNTERGQDWRRELGAHEIDSRPLIGPRKGGRRFSLTKAHVRLAQAAMGKTETKVGELCSELGISRVTLYRYVGHSGELREYGRRVLGS